MEQVPLLFLIGLDDTWDIKGCYGPVYFSHLGYVSENFFVPLNPSYISMEYNKIIQSYFREQGRGLQILINKPTKIMYSCSEK